MKLVLERAHFTDTETGPEKVNNLLKVTSLACDLRNESNILLTECLLLGGICAEILLTQTL